MQYRAACSVVVKVQDWDPEPHIGPWRIVSCLVSATVSHFASAK